MTSPSTEPGAPTLILYDGVCGLCNRFVRFILRRDPQGRYRFCALEDPLAAKILSRHLLDPASLNSVVLVINLSLSGERLLLRSDAVLAVLAHLGPGWKLLVRLLRFVPRSLRDLGYGIVARLRYRLFGRLAACPLPTPAERHRFLSVELRPPIRGARC